MRKIYQSAPDVPQGIANKGVDIIERHFTANGVRRAEDLPEESKVHLMRELQKFFRSEVPPKLRAKSSGDLITQGDEGFLSAALRWIERVFRSAGDESSA